MTVEQIYRLAIKLGVQYDLRPRTVVERHLTLQKKAYDKLGVDDRKLFDSEKLVNPYLDSRYFGDGKREVKRILAGIDLDTGEVLLADRLIDKGKKIDLLLFHHPVGIALAEGLQDVMQLQIELLNKYGVPLNIAQSLIKERRAEVDRGTSSGNYYKALDTAELLNIPAMCVHTVTDNMVASLLYDLVEKNKKKLVTVGDIMELLKDIPEYQVAQTKGMGPNVLVGAEDNYAGKIAVTEITGGTEGSKYMYEKLAQAGVGTVIGMHLKEEHREEAVKNHINVIIAGHMSSDSIGLNLFCDELEKKGLEIIPCSGFIRHSRVRSKKRALRK